MYSRPTSNVDSGNIQFRELNYAGGHFAWGGGGGGGGEGTPPGAMHVITRVNTHI